MSEFTFFTIALFQKAPKAQNVQQNGLFVNEKVRKLCGFY